MRSRVQKWGNSLAVRIPKPFALEVGLAQDSDVEISVDDGNLVISRAAGRSYHLADLLSAVTTRNLHSEVDAGPAVGRETW